MRITKRQLKRIIREEKRNLREQYGDEYDELDRSGLMTVDGLIGMLSRLPPDATVWVGRDSEYRAVSSRDVRVGDDVVLDADTGGEYKPGMAAFIDTWS